MGLTPIARIRIRAARGTMCAAIDVQLVPYRTQASPRGKCVAVRLPRKWQDPGAHDSTRLHLAAVLPASKRLQSPSGASTCRYRLRWTREPAERWGTKI
eukprot:1626289-Pleurochrysis_carterae.AAC.18